jgi:hypothetical protein
VHSATASVTRQSCNATSALIPMLFCAVLFVLASTFSTCSANGHTAMRTPTLLPWPVPAPTWERNAAWLEAEADMQPIDRHRADVIMPHTPHKFTERHTHNQGFALPQPQPAP